MDEDEYDEDAAPGDEEEGEEDEEENEDEEEEDLSGEVGREQICICILKLKKNVASEMTALLFFKGGRGGRLE